jgi:hypothetical protein
MKVNIQLMGDFSFLWFGDLLPLPNLLTRVPPILALKYSKKIVKFSINSFY